MELFKELLKYEEMYKDGVISEAECQKLKDILCSTKMTELGLKDEAEYLELLKREAYKEAVSILEKHESNRFKDAFYVLENLGNWGNASTVIDRYRSEYDAIKKQNEMEKAELARKELLEKEIFEKKNKKKKNLIIGAACAIVVLLLVSMLSSTIKSSQYEKKLAGHTYTSDTSLTISFSEDGTCHVLQPGLAYMNFTSKYSVKKGSQGYCVHIDNWNDSDYNIDFYILSETSDGAPSKMEGQHTWNSGSTTLYR